MILTVAMEKPLDQIGHEHTPAKRAKHLDRLARKVDSPAAAVICRAMAATERALSTSQPRTPASDPRIEQAGRTVLDKLAAESDPISRANLCDELMKALAPIVGDEPADVLWHIAGAYEDLNER